MALRITHLTFSSSGGAGTVARRLAQIQNSRGHTARVSSVLSSTLRHEPLKSPRHTVAASIDEFVIRRRSFHAPISLVRERLHHAVAYQARDSDILHIHWPHGVLDWEALPVSASAGLVWTLHDMRPFTGACHYSLGCEGFVSGCVECPAVKPAWAKQVSDQARAQKHHMEKAADRLLFVSPSDWLAETARRSRALADARISVIPNPLAPNQVKPMSAETLTQRPISPSTIVFVTAAANISDPVKGIHFGIEAFSNAVEETDDALLLVAGAGKAPPTNHSRVVFLGPVGPAHMAGLLSRADYLLVTSLAENQPLLISDAQSHGVSLIARDSTGLTEHATIDSHAKLFRSDGELTDTIRLAKESRPPGAVREQLQEAARERFSPSRVADEYLAVYEAALSS